MGRRTSESSDSVVIAHVQGLSLIDLIVVIVRA
jgi:hypothetical protein